MARIADVFIRLLADATGFRANVVKEAETAGDLAGQSFGTRVAAAISNSANKIGTSLAVAGKGIADTGKSMATNLTLPLAAVGVAAGKMALDFDTSLRQISGLTDVTQDELAGIREEILAMGPAVGKGPQELAEAFYFVASAGFEAEDAMKVLRTAAEASAAGLGETQTIAQVLGGVLNAYGQENIEAADAAGILTEAVSQGTAEASSFANVIGRVVPAAANLGVSFDQVTAALAGMTLTGLDAEESAVGLNQVFVSLLKPTSQAEAALTAMGLSAAGLRDQLKGEGLLSVLRTLEERFGGNEEAAAQVFGNVRALRTVTSLLTLDTEQLNAIFEKTANSGAARLAEAYEETEGPQRELSRAMADLQNTAIELGTDILPLVVEMLQNIANGARAVGEFWKGLDSGTRSLIVTFLSFLAVLGPVLYITGKLVQGFGAIFKVIGFLSGTRGLPALVKNMKALGVAGNVFLAVAAALLIFGEDLVKFTQDWVFELQHGRKELVQFNKLVDLVGERKFADQIREWGISVEQFSLLVEAAGGDGRIAFEALADAGGDLGQALSDLGVDVDGMSTRWAEAWRGMSTTTTTAAGGMLQTVGGLGDNVTEGISQDLAAGAGEVAGGAEVGIVDPLEEAYQEAVGKAAEAASDIIDRLESGLAEGPEELRDELAALRKALEDPFTTRERRLQIEGLAAANEFADGLKSGDPRLEAETFERLNGLLAQYETVAPGALERGKLVNPKFNEGINSNLAAALQWVQDNVTGPYTNYFELADVLEEMGYDSLAGYARGIQVAKTLELVPQVTAAQRAAMGGWKLNLYPDGYGTGISYMQGILAGLDALLGSFGLKMDFILGLFQMRGSPPFTHSREAGEGVGETWLEGVLRSLRGGIPDLTSLFALDAAVPYGTAGRNFSAAQGLVGGGERSGVGSKVFNTTIQAKTKEVSILEVSAEMQRAEYLGFYEPEDDE